jgi:heptosyltransferase-1
VTRVLLIKTSSLGDVIHCLPAVADAARQVPDLALEWLVESAYAAIPKLTPNVARVTPINMRAWRRRPLAPAAWSEFAALRRGLGAASYDAVIDAQGLIRLAWLGRLAQGPLSGYDAASIREPLASLFYQRRFPVSVGVHAAERMRRLVAQALGYPVPQAMDYGVDVAPARPGWLPQGPFAIALHGVARPDKAWAEANWIELGRRLAGHRTALVLPWGSEAERERAERLAAATGGIVAPAMEVSDLAGLFAAAAAVIGLDTGLTHLASAVGVPVVAIYAATWSDINGVIGPGFIANLGAPGAAPDVEAVWAATRDALAAERTTGSWTPTLAEAPPGRRKFRP